VLWPALRHKGAIIAFAIAEMVFPFTPMSYGGPEPVNKNETRGS